MKTIYTVKFSKWFVSGNLVGIMVDSSLTFPNLETAADYVSFCHKHRDVPVKAFGGSDYTIHCSYIETINVSPENLDACLKAGQE